MSEPHSVANTTTSNSRIQVLQCHGLGADDFESSEKAYEAADTLIATQRQTINGVEEAHPDIIFPGVKQLDQFWYAQCKGIGSLVSNPLQSNLSDGLKRACWSRSQNESGTSYKEGCH